MERSRQFGRAEEGVGDPYSLGTCYFKALGTSSGSIWQRTNFQHMEGSLQCHDEVLQHHQGETKARLSATSVVGGGYQERSEGSYDPVWMGQEGCGGKEDAVIVIEFLRTTLAPIYRLDRWTHNGERV